MTSVLRTNAAFNARTKPTTGDTKTSFVIDDHMGWLKCDGRGLDTTSYNLLFQVIGYSFGGSGASFNLPDAQGRALGSVGTVVDVDERSRSYMPGDSVGELDHQLVLSEIPSHNHDDNAPTQAPPLAGNTSTASTGITHNGTGPIGTGNGYGLVYQDGHSTMNGSVNDGNEPNLFTSSRALTLTDPGHKHAIAANGGNQYHNNVPPTLFYGNLFVYSGVPLVGKFPFTLGTNPMII